MIEIVNNKKFNKEIESEICLDEIMMNKNYLPKKENSNMISTNNNNISSVLNNNTNQSKILFNSLQDFLNRFEKDDKKILSNKKFIISFQELISLIKESMIAQQQIDNLVNNINDNNKNYYNINIQKINQKFINDLSYNIFSFDKIDICYDFNIKKKKTLNSNISPNISKFQNISKIKKSYNPQPYISPYRIKKEINSIFENIYKEVFINENNNPFDNTIKRKEKKCKKEISKSLNIHFNRTKSAIFNKRNISPLNENIQSKIKKENKSKNKKFNNTVINNINNNISYNSNNINFKNNINSLSINYGTFSEIKKNNSSKLIKSRNSKNIKKCKEKNKSKSQLKCSDIFTACENVNLIKNSLNKKYLSRSNNYLYNSNNNDNDSLLKKSLKTICINDIYNKGNFSDIIGYEELKFNSGIKKIIVSNTHKPSTLANKLLISGQKYIDNFREINEHTKKNFI